MLNQQASSQYNAALEANNKSTPDSIMWLTNTRNYKQWWDERSHSKILQYKYFPNKGRDTIGARIGAELVDTNKKTLELLYYRCSEACSALTVDHANLEERKRSRLSAIILMFIAQSLGLGTDLLQRIRSAADIEVLRQTLIDSEPPSIPTLFKALEITIMSSSSTTSLLVIDQANISIHLDDSFDSWLSMQGSICRRNRKKIRLLLTSSTDLPDEGAPLRPTINDNTEYDGAYAALLH